MTVDASHTTPIISWRTFLHTAAGATAGLAGVLALKTPPLYAATRTVTMLAANHFVPASDEKLKDYAKTAHLLGWPGPSDREAEQARAEWIVPNMFTYSKGARTYGRA